MGKTSEVRARRLDSLTGMRFVAAGMVFLSHIATGGTFASGSETAQALHTVTKTASTVGVSFFFLLSGFVLTWSARPGDTYGGFLRRRLVKIYPNHLFTFCLAMVLFAAAATPPGTAVLHLLLLQAWSSDPSVYLGVNGVSWSLSCELLFYALFPLLLPLVRRIRAARLWWWAGGVAAAVMLLPVVAQLLPATPAIPATGAALDGVSFDRLWFLYIFPLSRLLDFALGMLMARIVLSGRWIRLSAGRSALLALAGYVLGIFTPMVFTIDAVTVVPLALLVASLAHADDAGSGTPMANRPMLRLGEASFAFYLVHGIVLTYLRELIGHERELTPAQGVLFALSALAVSLVLALAMHRWIESPAVRRWGRVRPVPPPASGGGPSGTPGSDASGEQVGRGGGNTSAPV
uniref:PauY24 n=2 Tax=Streptomyces TaxID=1883 RepID=A0A075EYL7_9ACTN|nr:MULTISPECIES: acyltransferase [unclassified Streptomyces]AIE54244.1 PauY24 [Streptomyces sp. YN86]